MLTQLVLVCRTDRGWLVVACEHKAGDLALLHRNPSPLRWQPPLHHGLQAAQALAQLAAHTAHLQAGQQKGEATRSGWMHAVQHAAISLCSGRCIANTQALPASSFTVADCRDVPRTCWLYCPSSATCWTWCASMLPTKELRTLSMCLQRSGGQAGEQDQRPHHGGITHFQQACTRALLLHAQLYMLVLLPPSPAQPLGSEAGVHRQVVRVAECQPLKAQGVNHWGHC